MAKSTINVPVVHQPAKLLLPVFGILVKERVFFEGGSSISESGSGSSAPQEVELAEEEALDPK